MAINFGDAQVLSYDSQNSFFGDNISRYKVTKALNIQGLVGDLYNQSGVLQVVSGISGLIKSSQDFQPIILRNVNFGNGRVLSWSFSEGDWVRTTQYNCQVEIYETGNLQGLSGAYYGNLKNILAQPSVGLQFLESMNETFGFSQQKNGLVEATHNLDIKIISGTIGISPIDQAKYIASQIFTSGELLYAPSGAQIATGVLYSLFFPPSGISTIPKYNKRYYTEGYNSIDFSCNFSERFAYDPNGDNDYFVILSHSCQTDENGITNVTENGNIQGLIVPIYNSALSGYKNLITGAYSRSNAVFNNYVGIGGYLLSNEPITNGTTLNKFNGNINYSVAYTNNPNINSGYFWNYTTEISKNDEIISASQNGQFIGRGKVGTTQKYQNALQAYELNFPAISTSIGIIYSGSVNPTKPLHEIGGSTEMGNYRGIVGYTLNLSDDPTLIFDGVVNKQTLNVSNQKPTYIYSPYSIFGTQGKQGREILQLGSNTSLGSENVEINYNYKRSDNPNIQNLFNRFKQEVQNYLDLLSNDVWVSDCQFSVNEIQSTFNASVQINYTQLKNPSSVDLDWG